LRKYLAQLNPIPVEQRIIIGSAWESDLHIFNNPDFISSIKESKIHVLIVPHQLGTEVIIKIQDYLIQLGLKDEVSVLLDDKAAAQNITPVVILNMSGVLCELYSLFSNSYIGGGYERSNHSVLEPFFSGSQVYIGPKVHRSTEYDFLAEIAPSEIHVLFHPEQFYTLYMNKRNITLNLETRNVWRESASSKIWEIANAIGSRL
jgi:3-deoxy-D-manno-octulosonic-acid transferase